MVLSRFELTVHVDDLLEQGSAANAAFVIRAFSGPNATSGEYVVLGTLLEGVLDHTSSAIAMLPASPAGTWYVLSVGGADGWAFTMPARAAVLAAEVRRFAPPNELASVFVADDLVAGANITITVDPTNSRRRIIAASGSIAATDEVARQAAAAAQQTASDAATAVANARTVPTGGDANQVLTAGVNDRYAWADPSGGLTQEQVDARITAQVAPVRAAVSTNADELEDEVTKLEAADAALGRRIDAVSGGTGDVADGSITTAKLADGAVTTPKLADDAVTAAKIGSSAVGGRQLSANSVSRAILQDAAVTNAKIANAAVTNAKIAAETIIGGNIQGGTIDEARLDARVRGKLNAGGGAGGTGRERVVVALANAGAGVTTATLPADYETYKLVQLHLSQAVVANSLPIEALTVVTYETAALAAQTGSRVLVVGGSENGSAQGVRWFPVSRELRGWSANGSENCRIVGVRLFDGGPKGDKGDKGDPGTGGGAGIDATARAGVARLNALTVDNVVVTHDDWQNVADATRAAFWIDSFNDDGSSAGTYATSHLADQGTGSSPFYNARLRVALSVGNPPTKYRLIVGTSVVATEWIAGEADSTYQYYDELGGIELADGARVRLQVSTRTSEVRFDGDVPIAPARDAAPASKSYVDANVPDVSGLDARTRHNADLLGQMHQAEPGTYRVAEAALAQIATSQSATLDANAAAALTWVPAVTLQPDPVLNIYVRIAVGQDRTQFRAQNPNYAPGFQRITAPAFTSLGVPTGGWTYFVLSSEFRDSFEPTASSPSWVVQMQRRLTGGDTNYDGTLTGGIAPAVFASLLAALTPSQLSSIQRQLGVITLGTVRLLLSDRGTISSNLLGTLVELGFLLRGTGRVIVPAAATTGANAGVTRFTLPENYRDVEEYLTVSTFETDTNEISTVEIPTPLLVAQTTDETIVVAGNPGARAGASLSWTRSSRTIARVASTTRIVYAKLHP